MNSKINMKSMTRVFCIFLVISLIFTTAFSTGFVMHANADSDGSGSEILKLDEQAPAGLANAKNPYGYPEGVAFSLYKGNELMYYGGWNGSTERKMLNGSSVSDLKNFVKAPNKGTSDSSPVPSGTWNWIKAVAFDNDKDSTKEDKVLFVGVEENQKAYAWVLDYSTKKVSKTLELGNMDWIGYDYDQYSSTSLFQVEAGDFDGDGVDTLLVYAPLNLDDDDNLGCVLYELSYDGTTLSKANTANNLLMDQYIADQNKKTHKDHYDADIDCRDKLAVSMQVADFNGDNIDDLAVLSYSHYRYSPANTAYYSPQLKICYGGSSFKNFKDKKANETITLASTSGTTLTFPVAVSLAAGDYNGDGYDDLYAVGVKATATEGKSISSISVDGAKWYMHRLNGNSSSKMTDAGYTFVNSNAWFKDGFYASDYCYGQVMAAGVAISGNAAPEMLFAGGSLYDVSTGVPVRKAHDNYFDSGDEGLGAFLATNTFVQSVAVGNFDNNKAGREQVAFIIGMKEKGHDDYWFESGMISGKDFADSTYDDGSTCYGVATGYDCSDVDSASYIHENKGDDSDEGLNCFYIPMDHDDDGEEAMYLGVNYIYTDPVVNAVLQAAPYFGDVSTAGLNATSYTLETTYASDKSESNSLSANLGVAGSGSIPFAETTSFSVDASGGWCMEFTESHQETYSESFVAGGQDIVVVNRIPMLIYRFDVKGDKGWTGKVQMEMSVPEGPVYTLLSIDEYNAFVDEYNALMKTSGSEYYALEKIDAAANWMDGNEGNPYAYNQSGWGNASIEAEKICRGNGYALGKTGALTTVSFLEGESTTDSFTAHAGVHISLSILFGPKAIANYGIDFFGDYAHGWGDAITKGNAKGSSFTVQDLDRETMIKAGVEEDVIDLYGFTWTCGSWKRNLGNVDGDGKKVKTPFFGYDLTYISSPPMKVNDLKATKVEEQAITLSWSKPTTPKGWPSIDGYVLYQGISDSDGNVTYQAYKKIESADTTSIVIENLIDGSSIKPDTEYSFMIKSYHKLDSKSAYSDKSNVVTVHTPIKKYVVDLNYDEDAVDVKAVQQNGTSLNDGDNLITGTVIKVEAKAKDGYVIHNMIFTDNTTGEATEIKVSEDGNSATSYYQIVNNTTVDIT
ncbi:MAG: fibronectin type III domain-containing protein, partial [Firmicutes bacterium]|nr:fibronectin type III domain-containing protein [Bacillota bacterium]